MVADASALVEVVLQMPAAMAVGAQLFDSGRTLHAPHLLDLEVAQVIRHHSIGGRISEQRGWAALRALADMPIQRYPHDVLMPRIWALRSSLSAYDAVYVALAEALDAPLLTRDRRLAVAAGRYARIEVV